MDDLDKGISIIKTLKKIMDDIKQLMDEQLKYTNLTISQGMLIATLGREGKMKISDLSRKLGLSNSTVSGIIDRLERQGIIQRIRSEDDRRVVYVTITDDFKKNAIESFDEAERKLGEIMDNASSEELDIILKGLEILKRLVAEKLNSKSTR